MPTGNKTTFKVFTVITALLLTTVVTHNVHSAGDPSSPANEQSATDGPALIKADTAEQAAQLGLEVLRQIGKEKKDEEYAKSIGFNSTEEIHRSQIGAPLHLYRVPINRLKGFHKEDSLMELLYDTEILMYPILVDGQARSVITVRTSLPGNGWHATGVGYAEFIRLVEKYRTPGADTVMLISDLGLKFLATRANDEFELISLSTRLDFELLPGPPTLSARETFAKLAVQASKHAQPLPKREATRGTSPN